MCYLRQLARIGLIAAMCGAIASCGEPAQTQPRVDPAVPAPMSSALPDFSKQGPANHAASVVANSMAPGLNNEANFVGLRITAEGLEVILSGRPTKAEDAVLNSTKATTAAILDAAHADPSIVVPIYVRTVPNSLGVLLDLTQRLAADAPSWAARRITFSSFGPDIVQDVVVLHLQTYTPAAAEDLEKAYGPLLIVSTESQTVSPA